MNRLAVADAAGLVSGGDDDDDGAAISAFCSEDGVRISMGDVPWY